MQYLVRNKQAELISMLFPLKSIQKGQLPWVQPVNYVWDFQKGNDFPTINVLLWFLNSCYLDIFPYLFLKKGC